MRPINLVQVFVLTNDIRVQSFESNGELLDNGEMFLYRQGNILSALGFIPLHLPMDMPPLIIIIN